MFSVQWISLKLHVFCFALCIKISPSLRPHKQYTLKFIFCQLDQVLKNNDMNEKCSRFSYINPRLQAFCFMMCLETLPSLRPYSQYTLKNMIWQLDQVLKIIILMQNVLGSVNKFEITRFFALSCVLNGILSTLRVLSAFWIRVRVALRNARDSHCITRVPLRRNCERE